MKEWLVEEGIGEDRAILVEGGKIAAARLDWPGNLAAGLIADAALVSRHAGTARGTVRFTGGAEALVDRLPRETSEGANLRVVVTRAAIAERGRMKLAQVRPTTDLPRSAPSLVERLLIEGERARVVRRFPAVTWPELFSEAWDGTIDFEGGALTVSATPAMTLIDIDGTLAPVSLSLAAIPVLTRTIGRLDLAGSIGIDFPSLERKSDRQLIDEALARALRNWRHQSTAMNGFGFVQLVSRLERPSLIQRIGQDRSGAAARLLLRQAEGVVEPGALLLTAHPLVRSAVTPEWETELAGRTGRELRWQENPALALHAGFAQAVPR